MKNKKHLVMRIVGTATCVFALATLGSIKNPVPKPLKLHATAIWLVDLSDGSAITYQIGEATHIGRFTNEGSGTWNLLDFTILSASGTVTTADGGHVFWELPGSSYGVEFTSGTDRWFHLTGGFNTVWRSEPDIKPGPVPGTIVVSIDYRGEGTVTY